MDVLLTYTSYPLTADDWRGRFIYDLAHAIADQKNVSLRLWGPPGPTPKQARYIASASDSTWLQNMLLNGGIAHLLRRRPFAAVRTAVQLLLRQRSAFKKNADVDVAHINWLQNALPLYGTRTPLLVSALGSDFRLLRLPGMIVSLRAVFRQRPTIIAPNGSWMTPQLEHYFGDVAKVRHVPLGIDKRWYCLRREIDWNKPRKWLIVTRLTASKIGTLFDWGADLFRDGNELHLLGPMQEKIPLPSWVKYHGPTNPHALARDWYPNAAGMITLSTHHEGRPQVLLEAMASGMPILASPIPAHTDIVHHRQTGWLVESREALREGIDFLSNPSNNAACGIRAQEWTQTNIGTWDKCAQRYVDLYRDLCRR